MDYTYTNNISIEEYLYLRDSVGWKKICAAQADAGLKGSAYIIAAQKGDETIGMARLITDGGHSAFIEDVIVLPEYQRQGIGSIMVRMILEYLKSDLEDGYWYNVFLVSAKGKEPFYSSLGFIERPNETSGAGMMLLIE